MAEILVSDLCDPSPAAAHRRVFSLLRERGRGPPGALVFERSRLFFFPVFLPCFSVDCTPVVRHERGTGCDSNSLRPAAGDQRCRDRRAGADPGPTDHPSIEGVDHHELTAQGDAATRLARRCGSRRRSRGRQRTSTKRRCGGWRRQPISPAFVRHTSSGAPPPPAARSRSAAACPPTRWKSAGRPPSCPSSCG